MEYKGKSKTIFEKYACKHQILSKGKHRPLPHYFSVLLTDTPFWSLGNPCAERGHTSFNASIKNTANFSEVLEQKFLSWDNVWCFLKFIACPNWFYRSAKFLKEYTEPPFCIYIWEKCTAQTYRFLNLKIGTIKIMYCLTGIFVATHPSFIYSGMNFEQLVIS